MSISRGRAKESMVDLLLGDSCLFTAGIGSWVSSSGATSYDTTSPDVNAYGALNGSLKWSAPATNTDYVEVPVAGTFESGKTYHAVVAFMIEEFLVSSWKLILGVPGTDSASTANISFQQNTGGVGVSKKWVLNLVSWTPTANRSAVKLRVQRTFASGGVLTVHVGYARVVKANAGLGLMSFVDARVQGSVFTDGHVLRPYGPGGVTREYLGGSLVQHIGQSGGPEVTFSSGDLRMAGKNAADFSQAGIDFHALGSMAIWAYTEAASVGTLSGIGINIEVGSDGVGITMSEKDSGTIQFYPDNGATGYDIELVETNSGKHWRVVNSAGLSKALTSMNERKAENATATIASGSTSVVVTHGAGYTPSAQDITLVPTNNPTNDPGNWWISTITSTQFTINCRSNPGAGGMTFAWRVDR